MIRQLGIKRVLMIVVLLVAVCTGAFFSYNVFGPKVEETQRTLNGINGENSTLQEELTKMRADYAEFEKQKDTYDRITRLGFFNDQNRLLARERFDTIRALSKVLSARYEIKAATIAPDTNGLADTGFVMMQTGVSININALDDLDIYRFIYYLSYGFPGHISITGMTIQREGDVTEDVVTEITSGTLNPLVMATIDLEWKTLARKDAMESQNTSPVTNATETQQPAGQVAR